MHICPVDGTRLDRVSNGIGIHWTCSSCKGRAVTVSLARRTVARDVINKIWRAARAGHGERRRNCPTCAGRMISTNTPEIGDGAVDVCCQCQTLWFDATDWADAPGPTATDLADDQREERRKKHRRRMLRRTHQSPVRGGMMQNFEHHAPDTFGKWMAGMFGLPVETDSHPLSRRPVTTWATAALLGVIALITLPHIQQAAMDFGFIAALWDRAGGMTMLTSFFLHADLYHLLGNLYFLVLFGDNVEDELGPLGFIGVLGAATIAGSVGHLLLASGSTIPAVGASGGIAGLIVFYALQYPNARIGFAMRIMYTYRWASIPAWSALVVWIGYQFLGIALELGPVAWGAHLGGAAAGAIIWYLWQSSMTAGANRIRTALNASAGSMD